jgi:predicted Zn-ribbon and HTH transcriptional regulator
MKELTRQDFIERNMDFFRARKIYIESGLTNSLDMAWAAYQEILAAKKKVDRLNTRDHQGPAAVLFRNFPRPACPTCGAPLRFRDIPKNDQGVKSQLVCLVNHGESVLNSPLEIKEWEILLSRESLENIQKTVNTLQRVSRSAPLPGRTEGKKPGVCPECGFETLFHIKACCGAPNGYLWCERCQYEKIIEGPEGGKTNGKS